MPRRVKIGVAYLPEFLLQEIPEHGDADGIGEEAFEFGRPRGGAAHFRRRWIAVVARHRRVEDARLGCLAPRRRRLGLEAARGAGGRGPVDEEEKSRKPREEDEKAESKLSWEFHW